MVSISSYVSLRVSLLCSFMNSQSFRYLLKDYLLGNHTAVTVNCHQMMDVWTVWGVIENRFYQIVQIILSPFRLKIKSVLFLKIFYVDSIYNFIVIAESLELKPIDSYKDLPFSVASRLISVTFRDFASSIRSSSIFFASPLRRKSFFT